MEVKIKEELEEKKKTEERAAWEDESDATKDLEFVKKFEEVLPNIRKRRYGGKPHWYLVSPALPVRPRRRRRVELF